MHVRSTCKERNYYMYMHKIMQTSPDLLCQPYYSLIVHHQKTLAQPLERCLFLHETGMKLVKKCSPEKDTVPPAVSTLA